MKCFEELCLSFVLVPLYHMSLNLRYLQTFVFSEVRVTWSWVLCVMLCWSLNGICGVIVSMLASSVVDCEFELWSHQSKTIKLAFVASPLNTPHWGERAKTGWIKCPSVVTYLSAECCFIELALCKADLIIISSKINLCVTWYHRVGVKQESLTCRSLVVLFSVFCCPWCCPSIYGFWLLLWYLQTLLIAVYIKIEQPTWSSSQDDIWK